MARAKLAAGVLVVGGLAVLGGATGAAGDVVLFDNGPSITDAGAGFNGADVSRSTVSVTTFSVSNTVGSGGLPTRVMDDFVVPAGERWRVRTLRFAGTQRQNAGTESTAFAFVSAVARAYSVDPRVDGGASVIGGDFSTNRLLASSAFANAYRISRSSTNPLDRSNPIFNVDVDAGFLPELGAGQYWIEYGAAGDPTRTSVASTFPVTPLPAVLNGSQWFSGAYQVAANQLLEAPFQLIGVKACGPADIAGPGPSVGLDGELTADDIIQFIAWFTSGDTRADIAGPGPSEGPDGELTADDVILFISRFTTGC